MYKVGVLSRVTKNGCVINVGALRLSDLRASYILVAFLTDQHKVKAHDSSVGIALGYGLDDWGSKVRFPAGAGNFSLHHRLRNGSGTHPASYPMGTRGFFPRAKRPGCDADHSPPSSAEVKE
jgi:hypothetical protein